MALDLTTRTEYKAYAGLSSPNHDAEIDLLIPKVSQLVKTYCRRTFVDYIDDPKVERFSGGVQAFILAETPVVAISAVETSDDYGQTYTSLVEYSDWVLDEYFIVPLGVQEWSKKINGYRVTYTAGFESVPEDLKLAVLDLITYYRQNDSAVHSPKAPGTNSVQIEYMAGVGMPSHIRRILDLYKADYT